MVLLWWCEGGGGDGGRAAVGWRVIEFYGVMVVGTVVA